VWVSFTVSHLITCDHEVSSGSSHCATAAIRLHFHQFSLLVFVLQRPPFYPVQECQNGALQIQDYLPMMQMHIH
jgi:hypothetical protein